MRASEVDAGAPGSISLPPIDVGVDHDGAGAVVSEGSTGWKFCGVGHCPDELVSHEDLKDSLTKAAPGYDSPNQVRSSALVGVWEANRREGAAVLRPSTICVVKRERSLVSVVVVGLHKRERGCVERLCQPTHLWSIPMNSNPESGGHDGC